MSLIDTQHPCDIVLTTWGREWMTLAAIRALKLNTQTPFRLIIIDNGSTNEAQEKYRTSSDVYIKMDYNRGLEPIKHLAQHFVESEYFISMDNDILVFNYKNPDWLARLVDLMEKNPDYGAIACRPQVLVADTMYHFQTENEIVDFPRIPGYARIMRTAWVNEVGAWRDKRPSRGHEEIWICDKFREKGYKFGWANFVECWHLFGKEDTDEWGYPKGWKPEDHGHTPVWPIPKNDLGVIKERVGIDL